MQAARLTKPLPGTTIDPRYPDSDGRFMGDTDYHTISMIQIREDLQDFFASADVYVASDLMMYYEEGNPIARKEPDILVAKGVGKHKRRSYRFWEEKKKPRVLFEVASKRTWRVDIGEKRWLYATLGIKEYFLYDPEAKYLDPPLQGFRLVNGKSVPIKPNADGSLTSKELGLRMIIEGDILRFINNKSGERLLTRAERAEKMEMLEREKEEWSEEKNKLLAEIKTLRRRAEDPGP